MTTTFKWRIQSETRIKESTSPPNKNFLYIYKDCLLLEFKTLSIKFKSKKNDLDIEIVLFEIYDYFIYTPL